MEYQIDDLDKRILSFLMADSRMAYTEIAKELLVSPGTIHVRMGKMEKAGIVEKATLKIDFHQLGYDVVAFMGVYLKGGGRYNEAIDELKAVPEVIEAHYTTGAYGLFIKIVCQNTEHLRAVLQEKIQPIEAIDKTETFISLEAGIERSISVFSGRSS
ncbi:MAG: winged helix-turn-helix transcriptional regulator [Flavobacteriales bacterium]|nr:winged helix-turn-helix transcriptional regulator [Flavobacteriales bacterium]